LQKQNFWRDFVSLGDGRRRRRTKKNNRAASEEDERRCHDGEKGQVYVLGSQGTDGYKTNNVTR
jgi:hypothetical protein